MNLLIGQIKVSSCELYRKIQRSNKEGITCRQATPIPTAPMMSRWSARNCSSLVIQPPCKTQQHFKLHKTATNDPVLMLCGCWVIAGHLHTHTQTCLIYFLHRPHCFLEAWHNIFSSIRPSAVIRYSSVLLISQIEVLQGFTVSTQKAEGRISSNISC